MNMLMTLTEALQSTHDMDRESHAIIGLCETSPKSNGHRSTPCSAYLRRRMRVRRAA